jgi:hypothetical protein
MEQTFPRNIDVVIGDVSLREHGLLYLVQRIGINKAIDKVATRGKKRTKTNRCDITLTNPDGQLVNMLRWGRKIQIFGAFEGTERVLLGQYRLENPRWVFPKQGVPHVMYRGLGGDGKVYRGKGPAVYKTKTITEVVKSIGGSYGFQVDAKLPVDPKVSVHKPAGMTDHALLDQLAYSAGADWYVNDTTDPPTLIFRLPHEKDLPVVRGKRLTVGWGPASKATLKATELAVEHNYPIAQAMMGGRLSSGALFAAIGGLGVVVPIARLRGEREKLPLGANPLNPALSLQSAQGLSSQATTRKVLDCEFTPGIPFLDLNHVLPLVEMGDLSGRYRVIDVNHEIAATGWTTKIKAILGGIAAGGKKTDATDDLFAALGGVGVVVPIARLRKR